MKSNKEHADMMLLSIVWNKINGENRYHRENQADDQVFL